MRMHGSQVASDYNTDYKSVHLLNMMVSNSAKYKFFILILCESNYILLLQCTGRWNKRQLDPLMIFGIRCHLQYKFNISNKLWHKICQNMDSKCRSAWKRRMRGMVTQPRNNRVRTMSSCLVHSFFLSFFLVLRIILCFISVVVWQHI